MDRKSPKVRKLEFALAAARRRELAAQKEVSEIRAQLLEAQGGTYQPDPAFLLDVVTQLTGAKNDAELCRILEVHPTALSRVRAREIPMPGPMIISIHEETGFKTLEIKAMIEHGSKAKVKLPERIQR